MRVTKGGNMNEYSKKQIEEAIRFLNIQEIEILGAILYDADKKSLACYQRELHV